jgi:hypothetical protein
MLTEKQQDIISRAIPLIEGGMTKRIDKEGLKIYSVGKNLIRIDIKTEIKDMLED